MAVSDSNKNATESPPSTSNHNSTSKPNGNQNVEVEKPASSSDGSCEVENSASVNNVDGLKQSEIDEVFKADNLQQLSTSALPRYTPGSPPRFITSKHDIKSFDIHCCTACGDTFALKASLNFHTDRRSVLIKFPCETCKTTRIFYNRCNLLSHVRSHTDKNEKADLDKAVISILPRVLMDGIQNEIVSTLDEELSGIDDSNEDPKPAEIVECSLQEYDEVVPGKPNESENEVGLAKVKCLDCNEEFDTVDDRKYHLTNGDKMPVLMSQCNRCGLFCPSKCSLKAHQRIHLQISPYVCPECGESPDPHWANFLHHVNFACFHNSRGVGYKCPVCKRFSPSNDSLLKHMELHTEKYAKCSECPRAYNSAEAFKAHNHLYHKGGHVRYTMIFKCSLCDIVFVSNDQMIAHKSQHLKEQVCEYVFNCMQCGRPLESKDQLLEHVKLNHPKMYKQSVHAESLNSKPTVSQDNQYKGTVECLLCLAVFYTQTGYNVHISRYHQGLNQSCGACSKTLANRQEMIRHGKKHLSEKTAVCLLCNNKAFPDVKALDSHLDNNHVKKLRYCSFCPVCDRLFLNLQASLNHLRAEHFLPVKKDSSHIANILASPNTVCHLCRKSCGSSAELQNHLQQKHNINNDSSPEKSFSPENSSEQPAKKQRIDGNSCAKCDFHSANREDFKKHILSHKTNRNTFQCQECGQCFVVQPALIKHLRILHKISDADKYIENEGTNYMPDLESNAEVAKRSALECGVCFTSFPNETALKTHLRSHGMAFIQANKTGAL